MGPTRRLAPFLAPYWCWAVLAPVLMVLEVAMDLTQPRLVQIIVDQGVLPLNMSVVLHTGALMIGVALVGLAGGIGCAIYAILGRARCLAPTCAAPSSARCGPSPSATSTSSRRAR